jgi:hypothetical protein
MKRALTISLALLVAECALPQLPTGADRATGLCPQGEAPISDGEGGALCVTRAYRDFVVCMSRFGLAEETVKKAQETKVSARVGYAGAEVGTNAEERAVEDFRRTYCTSGPEAKARASGVQSCIDAFRADRGLPASGSAGVDGAARPTAE